MERPTNRINAPLLSIVVPTRNEAENVEALTVRLAGVLKGIPSQVVFVDDSEDDTASILDRLAAAPPGGLEIVVVVRPPERRTGLGSAAAEGLKLAGAVHTFLARYEDAEQEQRASRHKPRRQEHDAQR